MSADLKDAVESLRRHTERGLEPGRAGTVYGRVTDELDNGRARGFRRWLTAGVLAGAFAAGMALLTMQSSPTARPSQLASRAPATPTRLLVQ
jgi:hypothetical protein